MARRPLMRYVCFCRAGTLIMKSRILIVEDDSRTSASVALYLRHAGYDVSQRKRKLIEQVFGWMKTVGGLRKLRHRGGELVDWILTFTAAAYNLVRMRTLLARA